MRILFLTQWFDPEPAFKGLSYAQALMKRDHKVFVLTGLPNYPLGKIYPPYDARWPKAFAKWDKLDGVDVLRVPLFPSHDRHALRRSLNYLSFALSAAFFGLLKIPAVDVVVVYHPPATVGLPVLAFHFLRGLPYILDVQDLWPDTLRATGMVRSETLLRLIGAWCDFLYRRAHAVTVLSPGFRKRLLLKGVDETKVFTIYNWAPTAVRVNHSDSFSSPFPDKKRAFRVLFAGTIGLAQNLESVLAAAKILQDRCSDLRIAILGDGIEKLRLTEIAQREHLLNVEFLPRVSQGEVHPYLAAADILLVHLKKDPLFSITIPSKIQAYLALGKPIAACVEGDARDLIVTKARAGLPAEPGNPESIAECLARFYDMSLADRIKMGESGRAFYESHLSQSAALDQLEGLLVSSRRRRKIYELGKRSLDLVLGLPLFVLLLPVIGVLAVCIRWKMGAPVFFWQTRVGLNGKPFEMVKFRTMIRAYDSEGRLLQDADRLTPLGEWIRRHSLDELPQLWNVVRGELSLVGPRPLLPRYLPRYSARQARRHLVKPGLTGWAQVNGRNALSWDAKFELDCWYVDNASIGLDFRILMKTARKVLASEGISNADHATMPEFLGPARRDPTA